MAIGNIHKSGGYFKGILEYVQAEGKHQGEAEAKAPEVVAKYNLYGRTSGELAEEMRNIAANKSKVKKPVLHFSISFKKEDTTPEAVRCQLVENVAREMGIDKENHQAIIIKHNDKAHPHYHVVANRVGLDNVLLDMSFSKNRLELALDKQEKLMHIDNTMAAKRAFTYAPENKKEEIIKENETLKDKQKRERMKDGYTINKSARRKERPQTKKEELESQRVGIRERIDGVIKQQKPASPEELKTHLAAVGIDYQFTKNLRGLAGGSFRADGLAVKGSAIGLKANQLRQVFQGYSHERKLAERIAEKEKLKIQEDRKNAETKKLQEIKKPEPVQRKPLTPEEKRDKRIREINQNLTILKDLKKAAHETLKTVHLQAKEARNLSELKLKKVGSVEVVLKERKAPENGKVIYLIHSDRPNLQYALNSALKIFRKERETIEHPQKVKAYEDLMRTQDKKLPPKWQFWRSNERKEAEKYNKELQEKKRSATLPPIKIGLPPEEARELDDRIKAHKEELKKLTVAQNPQMELIQRRKENEQTEQQNQSRGMRR